MIEQKCAVCLERAGSRCAALPSHIRGRPVEESLRSSENVYALSRRFLRLERQSPSCRRSCVCPIFYERRRCRTETRFLWLPGMPSALDKRRGSPNWKGGGVLRSTNMRCLKERSLRHVIGRRKNKILKAVKRHVLASFAHDTLSSISSLLFQWSCEELNLAVLSSKQTILLKKSRTLNVHVTLRVNRKWSRGSFCNVGVILYTCL